MKFDFPSKSIFGFDVLGSWQSTFASYGMMSLLFCLPPFFGDKPVELKAGYLFLIIVNSSIIILTLNSLKRKKKRPSYLWWLLNIPLLFLFPIFIRILFLSAKQLIFT